MPDDDRNNTNELYGNLMDDTFAHLLTCAGINFIVLHRASKIIFGDACTRVADWNFFLQCRTTAVCPLWAVVGPLPFAGNAIYFDHGEEIVWWH